MPAKQAAKKAAKKVAKKAAKKTAKHHHAHDLRRAYEHMGRLRALQESLSAAAVGQIGILSELAHASIDAGDHRSAADLLRAGEHLAFGSLAQNKKEGRLSEELLNAIHDEYAHLTQKAEEHWQGSKEDRPGQIEAIYESMRKAAEAGFATGAFRSGLELARGAEALAHVRGREKALGAGGTRRRASLAPPER